MRCQLCETVLPPGKSLCPACKHWNLQSRDTESRLVRLSEGKVIPIERIDLDFLNPVFGGGLAKSSVNLIAGRPGGGKTTLFLQMADRICRHFPDRDVLYIASEQEPGEIKSTAIRLRIESLDRIVVYKAMSGLQDPLQTIVREARPSLIILDSLTSLVGMNIEDAIPIVETLKFLTCELRAPSMIVNQINKDEDHAGLMRLQHAVDALFMLDLSDQTGNRFLRVTKNRFGQAPLAIAMRMTQANEYIPGRLVFHEDQTLVRKELGLMIPENK